MLQKLPTTTKDGDRVDKKYFQKEEIEKLCPFIRAEILEECDSTSTLLKKRAEEGQGEFFVLFSKSQSAGRGRMGKSFISKKGGLYFSIILRPENLIKNSIFITPAAAVAAAKAIEKISGKEAKIKWVNDIFIADKKVCGILCESRLDLENSAAEYVILGVGINVFRPKGGYEKEIENIADALFSSDENGQAYLLLAAEFLNNFKEYYEKIEKKQYMKEYIDRSYLKNKEISFFKDSKFHSARVVDTDMDGNLIIEENGERKRLYSGEVSVKI